MKRWVASTNSCERIFWVGHYHHVLVGVVYCVVLGVQKCLATFLGWGGGWWNMLFYQPRCRERVMGEGCDFLSGFVLCCWQNVHGFKLSLRQQSKTESVFLELLCQKTALQKLEKLPVNWCRISSINSMSLFSGLVRYIHSSLQDCSLFRIGFHVSSTCGMYSEKEVWNSRWAPSPVVNGVKQPL